VVGNDFFEELVWFTRNGEGAEAILGKARNALVILQGR